MAQNDITNRPRAIQFFRQSSLPTYEEAVANVHHSVYTTTRFDNPTVLSGDSNYNGESVYQYAQAARAQVSDVSSRRQNVDICIQDQSSPSVGRMTQTIVGERERAARRQERKKTSQCLGVVILVIFIFAIVVLQFKFMWKH